MPYGIGQQIPHVALTWDQGALGLTYAELVQKLLQEQPRIAVQHVDLSTYGFAGFESAQIRIHPHTLREGEEVVVAERVKKALTDS